MSSLFKHCLVCQSGMSPPLSFSDCPLFFFLFFSFCLLFFFLSVTSSYFCPPFLFFFLLTLFLSFPVWSVSQCSLLFTLSSLSLHFSLIWLIFFYRFFWGQLGLYFLITLHTLLVHTFLCCWGLLLPLQAAHNSCSAALLLFISHCCCC